MTKETVRFCFGAAIGAAAALLLAPKSGRQTRALVQSKAAGAKDSVKASLKDARKSVTEALDWGMDMARIENLSAAMDFRS